MAKVLLALYCLLALVLAVLAIYCTLLGYKRIQLLELCNKLLKRLLFKVVFLSNIVYSSSIYLHNTPGDKLYRYSCYCILYILCLYFGSIGLALYYNIFRDIII